MKNTLYKPSIVIMDEKDCTKNITIFPLIKGPIEQILKYLYNEYSFIERKLLYTRQPIGKADIHFDGLPHNDDTIEKQLNKIGEGYGMLFWLTQLGNTDTEVLAESDNPTIDMKISSVNVFIRKK